MDLEVIGALEDVQIIEVATRICNFAYLQRTYGRGRWRRLKGAARIRLPNGRIRRVELHWYEAHGIGARTSESNVIWIRV